MSKYSRSSTTPISRAILGGLMLIIEQVAEESHMSLKPTLDWQKRHVPNNPAIGWMAVDAVQVPTEKSSYGRTEDGSGG
jgi:hypothetical protein